jgi:hypothetical protein
MFSDGKSYSGLDYRKSFYAPLTPALSLEGRGEGEGENY